MSEGEFDSSTTKHQKHGVESLSSLLVGTTAYGQPQLWDGAVLRIRMMTLATDARSKEVFKKVQAKKFSFLRTDFWQTVYEAQRAAMQPYLELATVADYLKIHFREKLDVPTLAKMVHMSVRQFERKFRATFQMTPRDYMIRMRVIEACDLLAHTNHPVTTVALDAGFYDHSDFARQFRRQMGQTASQYRMERRQEAPKPSPLRLR